jgi:hypothetical protein
MANLEANLLDDYITQLQRHAEVLVATLSVRQHTALTVILLSKNGVEELKKALGV